MTQFLPDESEVLVVPLEGGALTPARDQRAAADPMASVWVGASAGSGKTKVLADRVMRLLLAGARPEKILCLTFTRAAAAEMAVRLSGTLARWATESDAQLAEDLDALLGEPSEPETAFRARRLFALTLGCPGGMKIKTIHAFCQEVLKRFPLEAGVPAHFTVLEEQDSAALRHSAEAALWAQASAAPESPLGRALAFLARGLAASTLAVLLRALAADRARLARAAQNAGGVDALVDQIYGALDLDSGVGEDDLRRAALGGAPCDALLKAARVISEKGTKTYQERADALLTWLAMDGDARLAAFATYRRVFLKKDGEPFAAFANKKIIEADPEIDTLFRREAERLFRLDERLSSLAIAARTAALVRLSFAMQAHEAAGKAARAALDFDDLIEKTDALLASPDMAPWVLYKLDGGIDHMLVDEAQDTSPDQWRIIASLADEFFAGATARSQTPRTLFVVGDEKQSIYSFRKADPEAFAKMRAHFSARIVQAEQAYRDVSLNVSFRSARAVLQAVDAVFAGDEVRRGVSALPVAHRAFHVAAPGRVELWPLFVPEKEEGAEEETGGWNLPLTEIEERDPAAELADKIAARIELWVRRGALLYDRKKEVLRPMTPGDVMVLVQQRDRFVEILVRKLKARGVPVTGVDRMVLSQQQAVIDLMALLSFALLPEDDLTLAVLLKTPLLGLSEDDLMRLAIGRQGSLFSALRQAAKTEAVFSAALAYLESFLALADQVSPYRFLMQALLQPCPGDAASGKRALAARLGPDALDPIEELLSAARDFGQREGPSLQAFQNWIMGSATEIKREMAGGGEVRITTVHASKGLEAPLVILPDTVRVPDQRKLPPIFWEPHVDLPFVNAGRAANEMLASLFDAARTRQMEEYRRLFYVALTRAADRLIIAGWKGREEKEIDPASWYALARDALVPLSQPAAFEDEPLPDFAPLAVLADPLPRTALAQERKPTPAAPDALPPLPAFAMRPPEAEPTPPRPLSPSRPGDDETESAMPPPGDPRFKRGRILHALLQSLPDLKPEQWEAATRRFLAAQVHALTSAEQRAFAGEILTLLRSGVLGAFLSPPAGAQSLPEVPVIGRIGTRLVAGQVDRLLVTPEEVWVLDYKTNRPPPGEVSGVAPLYRKQMAAYRAVLSQIYPTRRIRCFLLWTCNQKLMELPFEEGLLER